MTAGDCARRGQCIGPRSAWWATGQKRRGPTSAVRLRFVVMTSGHIVSPMSTTRCGNPRARSPSACRRQNPPLVVDLRTRQIDQVVNAEALSSHAGTPDFPAGRPRRALQTSSRGWLLTTPNLPRPAWRQRQAATHPREGTATTAVLRSPSLRAEPYRTSRSPASP